MRLVSWNILACRGWRPGEHPDTAPAPPRPEVPAAITAALRRMQPDVIALQECPARAVVAALAADLGFSVAWFAARWPGNERWPGGFPGALLARWPLADVRDEVALRPELPSACFQRHWGSALVRAPAGAVRLHAYHCCADWGGNRHDAVRAEELALVLSAVRDEPTVLVGDHNARPGEAPLAPLAAAGFRDAHAVVGRGDGSTDPAIGPYQRIDQCWVRGLGVRACAVGAGADLGDDPAAVALSDHRPLVVDLGE